MSPTDPAYTPPPEPAYLGSYRELHEARPRYGRGAVHWPYIRTILQLRQLRTALDFGCGKGVLADLVDSLPDSSCMRYDPAIPEFSELAEGPFDVVLNTDVLEHIPEVHLPGVLEQIASRADRAIVIPHLKLARTVLPDGSNAHCTLKTPDEWQALLSRHYATVAQLPHHSDDHALLWCTTDTHDPQIGLMREVLAWYVDSVPTGREVRLDLDAPLLRRLHGAAKLALGRGPSLWLSELRQHVARSRSSRPAARD